MMNLKQRTLPDDRGSDRLPSRGVLIAVAATVVGAVLALAFLLLDGEGNDPAPAATVPSRPATTTAPSTTDTPRNEVVARLQQILRIRGEAIERRDSRLLESIYSPDCPCLEGDGDLIRRLRRDRLQWRGVNVSLQVEDVERVSDRLWTVSALVTASPFRVEKESGEVVRQTPGGRELSRFALTRPAGSAEWLLGQASLIERRN